MKLVALKKLRYPRGPDGKEYDVGDKFNALSERDASALTLVRAAKRDETVGVAPVKTTKSLDPPAPPQDVRPQLSLEQAAEGDAARTRRVYRRRDMAAEG